MTSAISRPGASLGFTLIELLTTLTIFCVLVLTAVPMYGTFIANSQIRTATESMLSGVRLAQTEAVKRNGTVEFVLDPSNGWTVNDVTDPNAPVALKTSKFIEGSKQTTITPSNAFRKVSFSGLGRIVTKNPSDGTSPLTQVDVTTSASMSGTRTLRVVIGSAYGIKACDPALNAADPAGCP
ncbi:MAG: GspH/FimT family protein [Pseudomonadota bacterium]|nr:GspH/FimT family protein [Pseudomonadota bacterium]